MMLEPAWGHEGSEICNPQSTCGFGLPPTPHILLGAWNQSDEDSDGCPAMSEQARF